MADAVHDAQRLKELQALPLSRKIQITQTRIIEWYQHYNGQVAVSFSGGKDSTVLLNIARKIYPDIPAVFSNTGLEYPEIQRFVKGFDNIDIITPSMRFDEIISRYGYPLISKEISSSIYYAREIGPIKFKRLRLMGQKTERDKQYDNAIYDYSRWYPLATELPALITHYCCFKMKKQPIHKYQRDKGYKPIIATLAEESLLRKTAWIKNGCNAFEGKDPKSLPLSFWTEQDILTYIVKYDIPIASVYGEIVSTDADGFDYPATDICGDIQPNLHCTGCRRTGCIFCGFGFHLEKGETRFQRLAKTHPRQYEYCIGGVNGPTILTTILQPRNMTASGKIGTRKKSGRVAVKA